MDTRGGSSRLQQEGSTWRSVVLCCDSVGGIRARMRVWLSVRACVKERETELKTLSFSTS